MSRLSFCNSVIVFSYFCDYAPVFRLACNDYSLQWASVSFLTILLLAVPFTFILLSYVSILATVFMMKSLDSRVKALATCVEHIILVAVFYIPILTIFCVGFYLGLIDPDQRVLSLSLASSINQSMFIYIAQYHKFTTCNVLTAIGSSFRIPPCVNPLIYSLKTREIKIRVLALVEQVLYEDICLCNLTLLGRTSSAGETMVRSSREPQLDKVWGSVPASLVATGSWPDTAWDSGSAAAAVNEPQIDTPQSRASESLTPLV
ncbi:olfactory receptor 5K4-like [Pseudochaenichthys georgianus]|uniref:olfactory receptor 5K4-like n=1 Tax=Pseudochaenichthys georgianus TaxID=52239 RepID=UPI0039C00CE3